MAKAKEAEKDMSFNGVVKDMNKTYGSGSVVEMSEKADEAYDVVTTGSIAFDLSLGIGGWQPGKLYELMGWEGTGKTTICGHAVKEFQRKFPDRKVVYIDAEHALDTKYFRALGVDVDKMMLSQPDYGEMGYNIAEKLIATGEVSLLIIDSNTAMLPKKVIDGEAGDNALGLQARLNSQMWPKIKNKIIKGNTCVIVISQFREKIGVMFGSPVTTNGGHALKFYSDVRIEVSKSEDKEEMGSLTKVKVKKNKMAPPYVEGQFFIKWGEGIDSFQETLDFAVELDIIKKAGSFYSYMDDKLGQGMAAVKQLMIDNPELYQEIKEKTIQKLKENGI